VPKDVRGAIEATNLGGMPGPGVQFYEVNNRQDPDGTQRYSARFVYTTDVSKMGFESYQWIQRGNTTLSPMTITNYDYQNNIH